MGHWKYRSIYRLFIDILKCFITACAIVLLANLFLNVDLTRDMAITEVLMVFNVLVMANLMYKMYIKYVLGIEDEPVGMKRNGCDAPIASAEFIATGDDRIAEYNLNISTIHEAGHALMAYIKKIESYNVHVAQHFCSGGYGL